MNNSKYLPIGSVVILKNATKRRMVIGYAATSEETGEKVYDYIGCLYPEGVIDSRQTLLFDHEQIEKIFALGYKDQEWLETEKKLKDLLANNKE